MAQNEIQAPRQGWEIPAGGGGARGRIRASASPRPLPQARRRRPGANRAGGEGRWERPLSPPPPANSLPVTERPTTVRPLGSVGGFSVLLTSARRRCTCALASLGHLLCHPRPGRVWLTHPSLHLHPTELFALRGHLPSQPQVPQAPPSTLSPVAIGGNEPEWGHVTLAPWPLPCPMPQASSAPRGLAAPPPRAHALGCPAPAAQPAAPI